MSRQLPSRPNLEYLRNEAKERLSELQRRQPAAILADAQHAIARDYGFASWSKLKAHVDRLAATVTEVSPFAGLWMANVEKSKRHPANPFQRATIHFAIAGDEVTITDTFVDEHGRPSRGVNTLRVDGIQRPMDHGFAMLVAWHGPSCLEAIVTRDREPVSRVRYQVSEDGTTLTISDAAAEQVIVLEKKTN